MAVSLMRPRSATACGLRATALRCSAPRASSRGRRRSRPVLAAERTAPTRAPRPRCAGQPWAPALLAATEIARRPSPPPRSTTSPHLVERTLNCARAGERERQARAAAARARGRKRCAPLRQTGRPCRHAVSGGLARLRERTCLSFYRPSEERCRAGRVGVPASRFRERRGAQVPRVAERSEAEESESALCARPPAQACYAGDLATKPWAPSTAAQSREGRRPQPTADA